MIEALQEAFPSLSERGLSEEYIQTHPDPVWDVPPVPLIQAIPSYMAWCVEHSSEEDELVFEGTIRALNEYSRAKGPDAEWMNFRFSCNPKQVSAVVAFLRWCQSCLLLDYEPVLSRAIGNWEAVNKAVHATSA